MSKMDSTSTPSFPEFDIHYYETHYCAHNIMNNIMSKMTSTSTPSFPEFDIHFFIYFCSKTRDTFLFFDYKVT